jgi:calcineurin-like phosphoesterase family protein
MKYGAKPLYYPVGKVYLFGDVHNEADKLLQVLEQVEPLITSDDHIVFCGDLCNRGGQAAKTIEVLVGLAKKYPTQVFFVRGNHDYMLANYLLTGSHNWMSYLQVTLDDFKLQWNMPDVQPNTVSMELMARDFREVTSRMIPYYETENLIATHAPLDPITVQIFGGMDYEEDYKDNSLDPAFRHLLERIGDDLMWQFTDESFTVPWVKKFRVCGHQPGRHKHPRIFKDSAFIDTGAGKGPRPITCMVYPGKKYWQSKP